MSIDSVRVYWRSHPWGWRLRWFGEEGHYSGELLSSAPPYRDVCSGSLNAEDARNAWRLVQATLTSVVMEPAVVTPNPHIGYVLPVGADDQSGPAYYYYPEDDKRASTRNFVQLVLILDSYMKAHYLSLISKDETWK